ncbi:unnamed protein product [Cladocopium goreaui]|uniref:UBC core domain-containing protein n=1 Tax=Cladocopium goreaui TaxID=2562237 RepID=A0A9P1BK79_9DINO|nr:unnamed protein product [Cladocopium goreaui]
MAAAPEILRRVWKEVRTAISEPDLGIYVPAVCLNEDAIWPVRVHAVIVSPQSHSVPMLISVTYRDTYPYRPMDLKFISRVPHPLIRDDGSIDLDILKHDEKSEWSPALTLRSVLTSLVSVLNDPTHPDHLREGCVANADWELGSIKTEPRNIPELFATLMLAAMPIDDWQSWRFLRGLRSLLCTYPMAYTSKRTQWYHFLGSIAQLCTSLRGWRPATGSVPPSAASSAKERWIQEAQALLKRHYRLDPLRILHRCRLREDGSGLGDLRKINRVWTVIQAFITDMPVSELMQEASLEKTN